MNDYKLKKMLRLWMPLAVSMFVSLCALGATKTIDGITWRYTVLNNKVSLGETVVETFDGGRAEEITYPAIPTSTTGVVSIPSSIDGRSVVEIGPKAFARCAELTRVTIPSTVTNIGFGAFAGCAALTSISIPSSVTRIGSHAFQGCMGLESVTVLGGVIGDWAFYHCPKLTSVILGSGVTKIGGCAFLCCESLTSVTIPSSVTSISSEVFYSYRMFADADIQTPFGLKLEAIVKETLDTTKGAEVDLKPTDPSIKTAPTRPGLTYTFSEGTTLEGMTQKAEKLGDGEPWKPPVTVKDGASGFYSIGVGK